MARPVPEWIGATETTAVPPRVWDRILERHGWACARCKKPNVLVKKFHKDHVVALVNWVGAPPHGNRECNLQPLCEPCHGLKTKKDVAIKALTSGRKKMRSGYARPEKLSSFKATRERLKLKYNWKKRRYERIDEGGD